MKKLLIISVFAVIFTFAFSPTIILAQQTVERDKALDYFKKGDYRKAVKTLKNYTKVAPNDHLGFYYFGVACERLNDLKDAEKALEKSIEINSDFADSQFILSVVYFRRNKIDDAVRAGEKATMLGFKNADLYYVLGAAYFRRGENEKALENAEKALELDPKLASVYLLKAYAVMNITHDGGKYEEITAKYGGSADNLTRAVILAKDSSNKIFKKSDQEDLDYFANYYKEKEKSSAKDDDTDENITSLKILTKPRASYTDSARANGIAGTASLLVAFEKTGEINHILVVRGLGGGLDEQAVKAARKIKFEPRMVNGTPVTTARIVLFSFTIY